MLGSEVNVIDSDESTDASSAGDGHRARSCATGKTSGVGLACELGEPCTAVGLTKACAGWEVEQPHSVSSRATAIGTALIQE